MRIIKEVWKDIPNYEGLYQVSNFGNVKSLNYKRSGKEKILKPRKNKLGYMFVDLYKNNKPKTFLVHRLVANVFLKNNNNLPCVNHKDENKDNNHIDNLEFCTYKENINYGTRNERASKKLKDKPKSEEHKQKLSKANSIPIIQLDLQKKFICKWESATQASKELNINQSSISGCCRGKRKTCGGFIWKYKE